MNEHRMHSRVAWIDRKRFTVIGTDHLLTPPSFFMIWSLHQDNLAVDQWQVYHSKSSAPQIPHMMLELKPGQFYMVCVDHQHTSTNGKAAKDPKIRKSKMRSPLEDTALKKGLPSAFIFNQIPSKPGKHPLSLALHSQKAGQAARLHHPSKHSYLGSWEAGRLWPFFSVATNPAPVGLPMEAPGGGRKARMTLPGNTKQKAFTKCHLNNIQSCHMSHIYKSYV